MVDDLVRPTWRYLGGLSLLAKVLKWLLNDEALNSWLRKYPYRDKICLKPGWTSWATKSKLGFKLFGIFIKQQLLRRQ